MILLEAHEGIAGGHYASKETTQNILCAEFWWPMLSHIMLWGVFPTGFGPWVEKCE
jgi:hypothetical protein